MLKFVVVKTAPICTFDFTQVIGRFKFASFFFTLNDTEIFVQIDYNDMHVDFEFIRMLIKQIKGVDSVVELTSVEQYQAVLQEVLQFTNKITIEDTSD